MGFGLNAITRMLLMTQWLHGVFGVKYFNLLTVMAYDWTVVIWLVYALMPVPDETVPNMLLRPQRWNEELLDATLPSQGPVLLGIEDIVDRAMNTRAGNPLRTQ
jgi:hypothetical protein